MSEHRRWTDLGQWRLHPGLLSEIDAEAKRRVEAHGVEARGNLERIGQRSVVGAVVVTLVGLVSVLAWGWSAIGDAVRTAVEKEVRTNQAPYIALIESELVRASERADEQERLAKLARDEAESASAALEQSLQGWRSQESRLTENVSGLRNRVADLAASIGEADGRIAELGAARVALLQQASDARSQMSEIAVLVQELNRQLRDEPLLERASTFITAIEEHETAAALLDEALDLSLRVRAFLNGELTLSRLSVESLVVTGEGGRVLASLASSEGPVALELMSPDGVVTVRLAAEAPGGDLVLSDESGSAGAVVSARPWRFDDSSTHYWGKDGPHWKGQDPMPELAVGLIPIATSGSETVRVQEIARSAEEILRDAGVTARFRVFDPEAVSGLGRPEHAALIASFHSISLAVAMQGSFGTASLESLTRFIGAARLALESDVLVLIVPALHDDLSFLRDCGGGQTFAMAGFGVEAKPSWAILAAEASAPASGIVHLVGHAVGLSHTDERWGVMAPRLFEGNTLMTDVEVGGLRAAIRESRRSRAEEGGGHLELYRVSEAALESAPK